MSIYSYSRVLFFFLLFSTILNCGTIKQVVRGGLGDPSINESAATTLTSTYVFATDYTSSGQLYFAALTNDGTRLVNSGVTQLGSSTIIRYFDGLIYVLHDGFSTVSTDNVQVIDPADDFNTIAQYSVGNGANPHDIAVSGSRAFVALYNPAADPSHVDDSGNVADVIEMDLNTGAVVRRWSFWNFLNNDGDRNGNAEKLILSGNTLFVVLQDLASNTFAANSNGVIGLINIDTNSIENVIPLTGRNPISATVTPGTSLLYAANMATYNFALGDFDLSPDHGGIEIVDLLSGESIGLIADNDLGGYVERVVSDELHVYAVVSEFDGVDFSYSSKIVRLPHDFVDLNDLETVDESGTDIREMILDGDYLWISRRKIGTQTGLAEPRLDVLNLNTMQPAGETLVPAAPGMSFAAP